MTNDLTLAICMYNAEKYIRETLNSIIDHSTDHAGFPFIDIE